MKNKKNKKTHICGICGDEYEEIYMTRDNGSDTGWLCDDCFATIHPEYDCEEW